MVVLCDGMLRSGSTWSFNVALKLLKSWDPATKVFGLYTENPAVLRAAARPRFSHLVIKSHYAGAEEASGNVFKIIYTWRSPYDSIVSSACMFGAPVESWIKPIRKTLRIWASHRLANNACIVPYEALISNPAASIEGIASYLGISVKPERVLQIAQELSLENMRRSSQHLAPSRRARSGDYVFDRDTLVHPNHIRNGGMGYGIRHLKSEQVLAIDTMLREEGFEFLCESHAANSASTRIRETG